MPLKSQSKSAQRAHDWYLEAQAVLMAHPAQEPQACGTEIKSDVKGDLRQVVQTQAELLRDQAALLADQQRLIAKQEREMAN